MKLSKRAFAMGGLFGVLVVTYGNCSNPPGESSKSDITSVGNPVSSIKTLEGICNKLTSCHNNLQFENCKLGILGVAGLGETLGLPSGTFAVYSDVISAEQLGVIIGAQSKADACNQEIQALNCLSQQVQAAFNPLQQNPFSAVPQMIPTNQQSCGTQLQISPMPGGGEGLTCVYNDIVIDGAGNYTCPVHSGLGFSNAVLRTASGSISVYSDSGCVTPLATDRLTAQLYESSGHATEGYLTGYYAAISTYTAYNCVFIETGIYSGNYFRQASSVGFDSASSFCVWKSSTQQCP